MQLVVCIYETFVRPVYEYAGEIGGEKEWRDAEVLQRLAGRMILGVSRATANEVVQGELGWWSVRGRLDMLRLLYFGKLCSEKSRIVQNVYRNSRSRAEGGDKRVWAFYTRKIMVELGLEEKWRMEEVGDLNSG